MFARPLIPLALLLLVALLFWQQRSTPDGPVIRTALVMGTLVEIKAYGPDRSRLEKGIDAAFAEMNRLEQLLSSYIPASEVSRLSATDEPVELSEETVTLLEMGLRISRKSRGAFDVSLGRLKELWDIEGPDPRLPGEQEIQGAIQGIGPDALQIEGRQVSKRRAGLKIDLGAIAKGYAVDRAVEKLRESGVLSAAVNAGGDIRLLGDRQGESWRIGIQHPRQTGEIIATLTLKNRAVVTSGDYERFFEEDGIRYHHLFDPQTGRPARSCQSVSVVAADAASADALATAAFVLGPDAGLEFLQQLPDVEGLLVTADGQRLATSGIKDVLQWH